MSSIEEELFSVAQILHLAHHRNKNQHRLAKWWKAFSMLRRHISKLITELETNVKYTALSAKSKKTIESREIVQRRVRFLEDVLMERCYVAFGGLVADNQYAALGLMLVGTLARVRKVIAPIRGEVERGEGDRKRGGAEMLEEKVQVQDQDLGEVIEREAVVTGENSEALGMCGEDAAVAMKNSELTKPGAGAKVKSSTMEDSTIIKRPKKKRKKGDAFDDLFAGLA